MGLAATGVNAKEFSVHRTWQPQGEALTFYGSGSACHPGLFSPTPPVLQRLSLDLRAWMSFFSDKDLLMIISVIIILLLIIEYTHA